MQRVLDIAHESSVEDGSAVFFVPLSETWVLMKLGQNLVQGRNIWTVLQPYLPVDVVLRRMLLVGVRAVELVGLVLPLTSHLKVAAVRVHVHLVAGVALLNLAQNLALLLRVQALKTEFIDDHVVCEHLLRSSLAVAVLEGGVVGKLARFEVTLAELVVAFALVEFTSVVFVFVFV